jgi:hypothetical protein
MVTVMGTGMDTPGDMDTGMAGITITTTMAVTAIMDIMAIMEMMDITASNPDLILVTGRYTPASIDRLTFTDRAMGRQEFHAEQDRIGTSRDPGRKFINGRSRTCTNDRKPLAGIQDHLVIQDQGKT